MLEDSPEALFPRMWRVVNVVVNRSTEWLAHLFDRVEDPLWPNGQNKVFRNQEVTFLLLFALNGTHP